MNTTFSNIPIAFPIISLIESEAICFDNPDSYFVCPKSYIPQLNKLKEEVIDSNGILYKRKKVYFIKSINAFFGFSIRFAQFGICYVKKEFEEIKTLDLEELELIANTLLHTNDEKLFFSNKKDVIDYLQKRL